ncbi:MAG: hypothetical protein JSU63_04720 [Phycisphaerales bacterium]|nr:MAG: hypothetical protein JSU63_04720 [Phycisphaerales bacterium]
MSERGSSSLLTAAKDKFLEIVTAEGLLDTGVAVSVTPLTAEQAIGKPKRRDLPIVEGKERVVEAKFRGVRAHAFTDSPQEFSGTLRDVLALELSSSRNRAVFIAVLNATLRDLGMIEATLHCRDDDPEKCATELADYVRGKWGNVSVGLIGFNPAIAEAITQSFTPDHVRITDLNRKNNETVKFGVTVWDGKTQTKRLIRQSDVVLVTGTFDEIWGWIQGWSKEYIVYGVTGACVCALMGWGSMCPYSRNG